MGTEREQERHMESTDTLVLTMDRRVSHLEFLINGDGTSFGDHQKVMVMWGAHTWILCTLSAGLGVLLTVLIQHFAKQAGT